MGELSETLEEFATISKGYYEKIQQILKDQYCWKCPMHSTSKRTNCNEIDAWIRITGAFEQGIQGAILSEDISKDRLEHITSRYISKLFKKQRMPLKYDKTIILKLKENTEPFAKKDDLIIVKENPESIKAGDLVLWSQICPVSILWFSKAKIAGHIPFNIIKISKTFHKDGCRYVMSEDNMEIPLEHITGKILKIIEKKDPIYSKVV
ncbi:hypothetical protein [Methanobacterium sp. ACI-7]|uniref:hypothetical protein n=1 Tax=unclassified Methanobacterium TaxID=2627676 RepID=UPI0039C33CDE